MNSFLTKTIKRYKYVFGLLSFICYAVSFLINLEVEARSPVFTLLRAGLVFISPLLFLVSCNNECSKKVRLSYSVISLIMLIHQVILIIAVGKIIYNIHDYPALISLFMWTICSFISFIRFRKELTDFLGSVFKDKKTLVLACSAFIMALVVVLLSAEPNGIRFCWDSETLYGFIYDLEYDSLFDARQLMFMKVHVSLIYVYIIVLLKLLTGNIRIAFFILNTLCIFAASFGMIFLFRNLVPGRKNISYMLAGAVFMFSPWVCGLSSYHIYDYYVYCLFPLMMYFYYRKNSVGFFCTGTMISFSRAPGLVIFGSVCLGMLICEMISLAGEAEKNKLRYVSGKIVHSIKYWYFLSVAVIFVMFFYFGRDVNRQFGDTKFEINPDHIFHLIKIYTTCNFLWVLFVPSVVLIFYLIFKRKEPTFSGIKEFVFVTVFSDIILVAFYCLLVTYKIPRYMDSHITTLFICGILMFLLIDNTWISCTVMSVVCAVMFMGSFWTIDPVSLNLFNTIDVGDHKIVDFEKTNNPSFGDSIVYNRECYSYEVLLGNAIGYVLEDKKENDEILFSMGMTPVTWSLSGGRYSYIFIEDKHYFPFFFDTSINGLANGCSYKYNGFESMISFDMHYIFPEENVESAIKPSDSKIYYYLYMPTLNCGKESEIEEKYKMIDKKEFSFRGWKMDCIKFSK